MKAPPQVLAGLQEAADLEAVVCHSNICSISAM